MRVAEVMSEHVFTVTASMPAADAWEQMRLKRIHHLVVTDGSELVGILSDRDTGGALGGSVTAGHTVGDLMTRHVVTAKPTDAVRTAANLMRGRTFGCLPVVKGGRLVGIVTISDLLELLGRGIDRPMKAQRPSATHRVAHRKAHRTGGSW